MKNPIKFNIFRKVLPMMFFAEVADNIYGNPNSRNGKTRISLGRSGIVKKANHPHKRSQKIRRLRNLARFNRIHN